MKLCARKRPRAWVPERMLARSHAPASNTYCFSTATIIRERASMLRSTHNAPLACNLFHCYAETCGSEREYSVVYTVCAFSC